MSSLTTLSRVVAQLDEATYHADPSLSSSGARTLLRSPALFQWEREHPRTPTREMQLGTCVHTAVLGVGQWFDCLPGDDLRVKATKDAAAEFLERGLIPLKPDEYALVVGMADAVCADPIAGPLLRDGAAEQSLFWRDPDTDVPCRARIDWQPAGRNMLVDLKTTNDASPASLPRHMARYGYPVQADWYLDGALHCGIGDESTGFAFIFVEREPPHLVTVAELHPDDLAWAAQQSRRARERFRDCTASGLWPGYDSPITVRLPPWARRDEPEEY